MYKPNNITRSVNDIDVSEEALKYADKYYIIPGSVYKLKKDIICESGTFTKGSYVSLEYLDEKQIRVVGLEKRIVSDILYVKEPLEYTTFLQTFEYTEKLRTDQQQYIQDKVNGNTGVYVSGVMVLLLIIIIILLIK